MNQTYVFASPQFFTPLIIALAPEEGHWQLAVTNQGAERIRRFSIRLQPTPPMICYPRYLGPMTLDLAATAVWTLTALQLPDTNRLEDETGLPFEASGRFERSRRRLEIVAELRLTAQHSPQMSSHQTVKPKTRFKNQAELRQFLKHSFNSSEIKDLCSDYFEEVYRDFTEGMTNSHQIQLLLDYCYRRQRIAELIAHINRLRPL